MLLQKSSCFLLLLLSKCSPDSESEISLQIGQYLMKLRRTKKCASFLAHPVVYIKMERPRKYSSHQHVH